MHDPLEQKLRAGLDRMQMTLDESAIQGLMAYLNGLIKWNKAYNLTAVREPEQMVVKHLLDSLSILPFVQAKSVIDVGTGGGMPGMVLAITRPEVAVTLLDSNSKKTRFLKQMAAELKLANVTVVHSRVEEFDGRFEIVTSRAFASLADMLNWCAHLVAPGGCFLAMKGLVPLDEIKALPAGYAVTATDALSVPFLDEERHLVRIEPLV